MTFTRDYVISAMVDVGGGGMPISAFLEGHQFEPETIRVMGLGFEMTIVALRLADRDDVSKETVARKIIALAQAGERDPERLCETALKEFQVPSPPRPAGGGPESDQRSRRTPLNFPWSF